MTTSLSPSVHEDYTESTDAPPRGSKKPLAILVVPPGSYRTADFVSAASDLRVDLVIASEGDLPMSGLGKSRSVTIDCMRPEWSASRIAKHKPAPDVVIAADDGGVEVAAMASDILGTPSNAIAAVTATRDKAHMRGLLANAGVAQPEYRLSRPGHVASDAADIGFPCVVKPRGLSASRGVIRVDTVAEAKAAETRIRTIIANAGGDPDATVLVESFVPGDEVAVEGMLINGELTVLALLDKPDPLVGPFFEETMFVTPSRHDPKLQDQITSITADAVQALGLVTGPIHGEVRCGPDGVVLIEIAARSIGGLCGRALSFGLLGESLESVIIRSALGLPGSGLDTAVAATGALMLPIPQAGTLVSIEGVDDALSVECVTEFDQTIPNGKAIVPLPEGDRYLGFLFAKAMTPDAVENALRMAHAALTITIEP